jgi:hypothetical protein
MRRQHHHRRHHHRRQCHRHCRPRNTQRVMMKKTIIFWRPIILFFWEPLYCNLFYVI